MPPVIKVKRRTSGKDVSRNRYNTFFNGNNYWKELAPLILGKWFSRHLPNWLEITGLKFPSSLEFPMIFCHRCS